MSNKKKTVHAGQFGVAKYGQKNGHVPQIRANSPHALCFISKKRLLSTVLNKEHAGNSFENSDHAILGQNSYHIFGEVIIYSF